MKDISKIQQVENVRNVIYIQLTKKSENKTSQASQKPTKNIEITCTCFDIEVRVKERVV